MPAPSEQRGTPRGRGRSERLDGLAADWVNEFGADRVEACRVEMYDLAALSAELDEIVGTSPIDVLVNNAHELGSDTGFNTADGTLEEARWIIGCDTNCRAVLAGTRCRRSARWMKERRRGSIVNISTMYAQYLLIHGSTKARTLLNPPGYSSAKAGMLAFTRYVASFWGSSASEPMRSFPARSRTPRTRANSRGSGRSIYRSAAVRTMLGRGRRPTNSPERSCSSPSDASNYVTGHALMVRRLDADLMEAEQPSGRWTTTSPPQAVVAGEAMIFEIAHAWCRASSKAARS